MMGEMPRRDIPMRNLSWIDLLPPVLKGAEEEQEQQEQEQEEEQNDGSNDGDQHEEQQEDKGEESGLQKALRAERKARAAAEKRAKAAEKAEEERKLAEKSEVEQAQTKLQAQQERNQKLASALLERDLKDAIEREAKKLKFIDTDDALAGVDRNALSYEQDEDDPTQITIDVKSIEREVKRLAAKKPHFLSSGTDDGQPSGSGFGGSKGKSGDDEKKFLEKYPSLG